MTITHATVRQTQATVIRVLLLAIVLLCGAASASAQTVQHLTDPGTPQEQNETLERASQVLALFDAADYDGSWALTGNYLRTLVAEENWPRTIAAYRGGLGAVQEREPDTIGFTDELAGAPPGRYVIVMFRSRFEHKAIREKVVLVHEDDDWKLAGYFVRHPLATP